jgi:hypothetical protein
MESLSQGKMLLALAFAAFASGASAQTTVQDGRAYLMVEDFKTLLGADAPRDPSSEARLVELAAAPSTQEGVDGGRAFRLLLPVRDVSRLRKEVRGLELQREKLAARLQTNVDAKKKALREKRRELQTARLSARSDADAALGKSLYESILEEANLEAQAQRELAAFDETHAIELSFREVGGERTVRAIQIAGNTVWSKASLPTLAAR